MQLHSVVLFVRAVITLIKTLCETRFCYVEPLAPLSSFIWYCWVPRDEQTTQQWRDIWFDLGYIWLVSFDVLKGVLLTGGERENPLSCAWLWQTSYVRRLNLIHSQLCQATGIACTKGKYTKVRRRITLGRNKTLTKSLWQQILLHDGMVYLFDWCFTSYWRMLQLHDKGQQYGERKSVSG